MIHIIHSQKEKCEELRQQYHALQERLTCLTQERNVIQSDNQTKKINDFANCELVPKLDFNAFNDAQEQERQLLLDQESLHDITTCIMKICNKVDPHFHNNILANPYCN